ncbi:hypothetical protein LMF57_12385 [Stenotrophomonas sp. SI-NJAU-1]|uniref:hypothetical protein n=1 Tax=Stenotrophomonas sp. SI-NJAU-1 TaxID=2886359 RepID=UPI001E658B00|nr:hypothetical protein [Stenotrophomonas sp. SI-NJAU-1]UEX16813.1 hypothetical protein LMF57_12385 [Stenotrophomonas sp. SI-NJAU-1]
MGSKVVIVRLEEPDAGEELSAVELTWAHGTEQGDGCDFQFISGWDSRPLVLEKLLDAVNGKLVQPGDASVADAWDAFGIKVGQVSGKQLKVVTHQWASADGSYIVRRVSFLEGGKWNFPKTQFVVLPSAGSEIVGIYADPALAVAEAEKQAEQLNNSLSLENNQTNGIRRI